MADGVSLEAIQGTVTVRALRYTLAVLDEHDRQLAGSAPDTVGVRMTVDEAVTLAPELASLLIDAVVSLVAEQGLPPEDRPALVRRLLQDRLQSAEMDARFAAVEAEVKVDPKPVS
jgi:hypothetical protein